MLDVGHHLVKVITDMIQKGGSGLSMVRSLILLARLKFLHNTV